MLDRFSVQHACSYLRGVLYIPIAAHTTGVEKDVVPCIQGSLRPKGTRCEYGWGFPHAQDCWCP